MDSTDMSGERKAPSLVDLCLTTAIDNVRFLGDVGETDIHLLEEILPHCTVDQLMHVEKSTKGRDLTPVTDKLWRNFYEKEFGEDHAELVIERMRQKNVSFRWMQLYEAKSVEYLNDQEKAVDQLKQRYAKENDRKRSRQIQICNKLPPSSNKRTFGGTGFGNVSNSKNKLMRKAKMEMLNSQEMKNLKALRRNAVQRTSGSISTTKKPVFGRESSSASTSKPTIITHMGRRY